ncbi:DUF4011 domain-containing protein [Limimaricola pyoseonensis]|uniref:AAA domain-containing protein n=1 Tax=Limimaricola pyoseonensis TaxID=521013 RepID=A0A1G7AJC5_9RHOB|nr:DUF4011 domain-containing protein [Limimaricola pyoseonensis]SDE14820.1 AAA domain-containing protein [Limimaricola pyoseonensis]
MKDQSFTTTEDSHLKDPEIISLVSDRLEELRKRLLDSSRRNPLINIPFKKNSTTVLRVVDELPEILRYNLTNGTAMRLVPLPAIEEELPDEQTDEFLDALHIARSEDEQYLSEIEALDPDSRTADEDEYNIERALKDRLREALGLPKRQTTDNPSLIEHAKAHGISPHYALPEPDEEHEDGRHNDTDIQTLMLPEKLSRVAKQIAERGRSYERESGVNVLHAAFGLLEWKNPGESKAYVSPLLLCEIRIERKQSPQGAQFLISGEGKATVNTTLKQKLFTEHRLDLPDHETGSIEDYFRTVAEAAPSGWHWKVRREVAIGIFPSSKIAMYHDLDPKKRSVAENATVAKLLATSGGGEASYADVYGTDEPEMSKKVPHLVMDADASQFSALVDVANGQDVSIEGPPGSGKSQTIVNLIAAALREGKKVLFVAEKLTALDVVKNRLESANLGEFILPLQAGKGTRDKVYHSLEERLSIEIEDGRAGSEFSSRQRALEKRRQTLQDYLDILSQNFGSTGLTVYEVIGHAIATNEVREIAPKDVRRIRVPNCDQIGPAEIDAIVEDAKGFADRLSRISRMPRLWLDAQASIPNRDDAEDICERLESIANDIEQYVEDVTSSDAAPLFSQGAFETDITALRDAIAALAEKDGQIDGDLVDTLTDAAKRRSVRGLCDLVKERQSLLGRLRKRVSDPEDPSLEASLNKALAFARSNDDIINAGAYRDSSFTLERWLGRARRHAELANALPANWAHNNPLPLDQLHAQASWFASVTSKILAQRIADPEKKTEALGRELKSQHADLTAEIARIRKAIPHAGDHSKGLIERTADIIEQSGLLRFMSSEFKNARNTYTRILGGSPVDDRPTMTVRLRTYGKWLAKKSEFENHTAYNKMFGDIFKGLDTDISHIDAMCDLHRHCDRISCGDEDLRRALESGDLTAVLAFAQEEGLPSDTLYDLKTEIDRKSEEKSFVEEKLEEAEKHLALFNSTTEVSAEEIAEAIKMLQQVEKISEEIETASCGPILGDRFKGIRTDIAALEVECTLSEVVASSPAPDAIRNILRSGQAPDMLEQIEEFKTRQDATEENVAKLCGDLQIEGDLATSLSFAKRMNDLRAAASDPSSLMERARLRRSEETLRSKGFDKLVDWVLAEGESFDPDKLAPLVRSVIAKSMADKAYEAYSQWLQGYDGEEFDRIRAEIIEKDRELIAMSRQVVRNELIERASPPGGNSIGRKSTYTNMSLLRNEMGKKKNRLGVRELTRRAGQALQELKPCWMMSPLAVAQYLHSGLTFDLVVIDEASQMTPENAIGALSRAKQSVIVGDTKQLPPTTFFQKMLDDSDADEDLREDSESILDMANMAFRPVRQLRWHYRSRHSALIRFSNEWMYDSKLTIFPSAREDDPEFGVHLVEVDGIYKGKRNDIEAREVVKAAVRHMREHPSLSLGIVTMNTDQKDLILEEFERERDRNPHVQAYVRQWEEHEDALEHFFVKNLETIQGDERDVMFISTLYGPEVKGSKPHQRFGPINSAHGHRRLNVLFTRAKRKIVTFTSLKPTDILVDEGKNRGVHMFRAWLEYCGSGYVPSRTRPGGETDSPFEDYVIQQVEALGCEAVPQVGTAGYRVDIGVRHPEWPYGYILGVECDGASYHSSKSSRDRDRLRQEVLEGLGWRFHRIWSTDWFNDPRTQVERLKEAIDAALVAAKESGFTTQPRIEAVKALQDVVEEPEETPMPVAPPVSAAAPRGHSRARQSNLFDGSDDLLGGVVEADPGTIMAGSKVKVEILSEQGRKLSFQLVEEENDIDNGKVGIHTPLGQALIDAQEGDEVEYQVGVEIKSARILQVR